jgi:hypothetical protein
LDGIDATVKRSTAADGGEDEIARPLPNEDRSGDEAKEFRKAVAQYIDTRLSESVIEPIITEYEEHL